MPHIVVRKAETREELDQAAHLRYLVFARELGNIDTVRHAVPREADGFDLIPTTVHFLAYLDGKPVGTARMILPNPDVARDMQTHFGFDIETKFDLSNLAKTNVRVAETMRYCVLPGARHTSVALAMIEEGARVSRDLGIDYWIGSSTIETSDAEEAQRIASWSARMGLVHRDIRITPRNGACPPLDEPPEQLVFPEPRLSLVSPSNNNLPRILSMYSRRLGARIIGPPMFDQRFRGYSIPILMEVAAQERLRLPSTRPPPLAA